MATLHITNITGSPLSFSCLSPVALDWTNVDHESKATVFVSSSAKRTKRPKIYISARRLSSINDEKSMPASEYTPTWLFTLRRPRSLRRIQSWYTVHPVCQHILASSRRHKRCLACQQDLPWRIYVLHAEGGSHLLFLRARDMSRFLSETEDERLLSDVVLPGTHDSLAFYGWPVSQCQSPDQPLYTQLMSGIRVLDVRQAVVDGVLMSYHGGAPQYSSFSAILHTFYHFLREHPGECLVVSMKQEDYATTHPRVFSRLVREEIERSQGGMGMWWLENRIPTLGEVRGRCIMFSRFGGDGKEWEGGLEGMGIHPTSWPDSKQEGFEWDLKGTTVRTHDWYSIPSLLSLPEKASLCIQNLVPPPSDPPTLAITYLSASGGPLALPPFCALGFGWPSWGLGVEGINTRIGSWLIDRLTASGDQLSDVDSEKVCWSTASNYSSVQLLDSMRAQNVSNIDVQTLADGQEDSKLPVRGWVFMDYFAEPDGGIVPLLVENNFIQRY